MNRKGWGGGGGRGVVGWRWGGERGGGGGMGGEWWGGGEGGGTLPETFHDEFCCFFQCFSWNYFMKNFFFIHPVCN